MLMVRLDWIYSYYVLNTIRQLELFINGLSYKS